MIIPKEHTELIRSAYERRDYAVAVLINAILYWGLILLTLKYFNE